jgi:ABC-type Fe3+-siderophore transport system permease subunit
MKKLLLKFIYSFLFPFLIFFLIFFIIRGERNWKDWVKIIVLSFATHIFFNKTHDFLTGIVNKFLKKRGKGNYKPKEDRQA